MLEGRKLEVRADQLKTSKDVNERRRLGRRCDRDFDDGRVLIIAGCQQRHRAFVIGRAPYGVQLFVQLRNRGENQREHEGANASRGDQDA